MSITPYEIEENDDIICNICLTKKFINDISNNNINGTHIKCSCKRGFICEDCIINTIRKCPICRTNIENPLYIDQNNINIDTNHVIVNTNSINMTQIREDFSKIIAFIMIIVIFGINFGVCFIMGLIAYIVMYGFNIDISSCDFIFL